MLGECDKSFAPNPAQLGQALVIIEVQEQFNRSIGGTVGIPDGKNLIVCASVAIDL